jgi:hypothetical protein
MVQTPTHTKSINGDHAGQAMTEQVQETGKSLKDRIREALEKLPSIEEQLKKLRGLNKEK